MEQWPMNFAAFCRQCAELGAEIRLKPLVNVTTDEVTFYAHPNGRDGATVDYFVRGDELVRIDNRQK